MVKKTKSRKKPIKAGDKKSGVVYDKLSRIEWGKQALLLKSNAIDYGKKAKARRPPTPENYAAWFGGGHRKYDLEGYDHPRPDIKKIPKTYYKYAGAPKGRVSKVTQMGEKIFRKNFTAKERKDIGKVFIDSSAPKSKGAVGTDIYYPSDKMNVIHIAPEYTGDEDVVTHELIHARRYGTTGRLRDINRDEKETEFENIGRLSSTHGKRAGYYQYVKGGLKNERKGINHDRILLTGSLTKQRKGKRYMADVKAKYPQSIIKDAHFSPAENLDRYFQIILPSGKRAEVHRRYKPNVKESKSKILKQFKAKFGTDIKAYEWENGKRVRIGGTVRRKGATRKPKARVRKRTVRTKKAPIKKTPKKVSVKRKAPPKKAPVKRKVTTKRGRRKT